MKRVICFVLAFGLMFGTVSVKAVSTSAKAAVLINADTGEIIYSQNSDEKLPMASTTKIMTALLLCETGDMEKEITVTEEMVRVEGTSMGLLPKDKVTYHALLYGMLLASGNDAANVTAYALGGTVDGFVKLMNKKAQELGLTSTHFETPSGLDGEEHYTTASDLAFLAKYAMENELFAKAASSKSETLYYGNPPYRRTLTNHNKLLKTFDGAIGVKTGFTKKSGRCLVSCAERDGKRVIAVTLNDGNDWKDHTSLLNYGLDKIKITEIVPQKTKYTIPVIASDIEKIEVEIEPFEVSYLEDGDFSCEINLPTFLYAPLKNGDTVGEAVYYKKGEEIARKEIKSNLEIKEITPKINRFDRFKECFKLIIENIWES